MPTMPLRLLASAAVLLFRVQVEELLIEHVPEAAGCKALHRQAQISSHARGQPVDHDFVTEEHAKAAQQ